MTSKVGKSKQNYGRSHLPFHCLFSYLARTDAWHGVWICVHSKDAQEKISVNVFKSFFHFPNKYNYFCMVCKLHS